MGANTRRRSCSLLVLVVCAAAALLAGFSWNAGRAHRLLTQTREAQSRGDHSGTLQLATKLLRVDPDLIEARRAAASSAVALGLAEEAITHLRWVESKGGLSGHDCFLLAEASLIQGKATTAEEYFQQALVLSPGLHAARSRLIYLLALQCRVREATAQRYDLLRQGVWSTEHLLYLAKPEDLMLSGTHQKILISSVCFQ